MGGDRVSLQLIRHFLVATTSTGAHTLSADRSPSGTHDPGQGSIIVLFAVGINLNAGCSQFFQQRVHVIYARGRLLPRCYRKHCIEQTLPPRRKLLPGNAATTRPNASTNCYGVSNLVPLLRGALLVARRLRPSIGGMRSA